VEHGILDILGRAHFGKDIYTPPPPKTNFAPFYGLLTRSFSLLFTLFYIYLPYYLPYVPFIFIRICVLSCIFSLFLSPPQKKKNTQGVPQHIQYTRRYVRYKIN
jgi:hypothetical protein